MIPHDSYSSLVVKSSHVVTGNTSPCLVQGSVNGGFPNGGSSFVRRSNSPTPFLPQLNLFLTSFKSLFYLNLNSFFPRFYLILTSFKPLSNLCFVGTLQPRFGNHGLQTLGWCFQDICACTVTGMNCFLFEVL